MIDLICCQNEPRVGGCLSIPIKKKKAHEDSLKYPSPFVYSTKLSKPSDCDAGKVSLLVFLDLEQIQICGGGGWRAELSLPILKKTGFRFLTVLIFISPLTHKLTNAQLLYSP